MKNILILFISVVFVSCQTKKSNNIKLNQEMLVVADSISQLMTNYHYNPKELSEDEYLRLEKDIQTNANKVDTKEGFIKNFNQLWSDGPFSHVRLAKKEQSAEDMAAFIDSMRAGDQSVSLEWKGKTALLTVTTMTGVDTQERIFEAYRTINKNKAEALIIDLRNNEGGTFAGIPLVGHLMKKPIDVGMFVSRKWWDTNTEAPGIKDLKNLPPWEGWSIEAFWKDVQQEPVTRVKFKPMMPYFNGPVYVLISKKTASAAEFTVDAMAHLERVTIIGETTAGEMLSQKMFDLPNELQLSLPIAEYYSTRTGRIEGRGVSPDINIDPSVSMELASLLIQGMEVNQAITSLQEKLTKMEKEPLNGEVIYMFGTMNDWGKNWKASPKFEYEGKGIYKATASLKEGKYEFKIAPMDWDFDFGAIAKQEQMTIGKEHSLIKKPGSDNIKIELIQETALILNLDLSNINSPVLKVEEYN